MWTRGDEERKCRKYKCMERTRGWWKCVQCKTKKPNTDFSSWLAQRTTKANDGKARCDECDRKQKKDAERVARASMSQAMARR